MFNPVLIPLSNSTPSNLFLLSGDQLKLKSLLTIVTSTSQTTPYTFTFPNSAGTTGQALFWSGSETTFRGIAIADVATLQTSLNTINTTLASLGTSAFQATSYFALSDHVHSDATTSVSGFLSGADKARIDSLGTVYTKNTGTTNGTVPLIGAGDKLSSSIIPDITGTTSDSFTINSDAAGTGSDRSVALTRSASQSSSYSLILPASLGSANQALIISSISGSSATLSWGNSGGGFSSVSSFTTSPIAVDLANGNHIAITLNGNTTISSISGITSGSGAEFMILVTQDATGSRTLSFPSGVTLTGTISASANSTSVIQVTTWNGGTSWEAIVIKPVAGTSVWTPSNITTKWWLDPGDSSTILIGSGVSQINDKKGLGSLIQSTASAQPAYISAGLNGKNILRFDGNDGLSGTWDTGNAKCVIAVYKQNSTQFNYAGLIGGDFICTTNDQKVSIRKVGDASIMIDSTVASTQFNIVVFQIAPNNAFLRVNGTFISTDVSYNAFSGSIAVGLGGAIPFVGDLAKLIITEDILSAANIEKIEGYLASPDICNLQSLLPSTHPYKSSPPMV